MSSDRLDVAVTFDAERGYVASAPELRAPVTALSLGGLRRLGAPPHRGGKSCKVCGVRFRPRRAILRKEVRVMAIVPEKYLDLLQRKKAFANLATVMPDGSPQVTPVWCDYKDGLVRVNTAKGRVKARNLKKGVAVALAIVDPDNPYRYVQIRGRVRRVTEDGAVAHIDSLAKKYLGQDKYTNAAPGEVRLMCEIEPTSASGMG
jgi:PPOX class probable F420-dependent enzyme